MKANEAPEKLYIALSELTEDGRTFVLDHRVDYPTCTEYIRTDVFIEKFEYWMNENFYQYAGEFAEGILAQFDRTEDAIESFRKYMKGE